MHRGLLSLIAMLMIPNGARACTMPVGWTPLTPDVHHEAQAAIHVATHPVPVSQPFDAHIWICADASPETVSVSAIMPAHQHGMNYRPAIFANDDGTFLASGMVFHMPGDWRIEVAVQLAIGTVYFSSGLIAR